MTRFRLKSSVEPLSTNDGALYLVRAGADDLVVRDAQPVDRELVELLADSELTGAELAAAVGLEEREVRVKLDALAAAGVLTSVAGSAPLDREDAERFSRQLP